MHITDIADEAARDLERLAKRYRALRTPSGRWRIWLKRANKARRAWIVAENRVVNLLTRHHLQRHARLNDAFLAWGSTAERMWR